MRADDTIAAAAAPPIITTVILHELLDAATLEPTSAASAWERAIATPEGFAAAAAASLLPRIAHNLRDTDHADAALENSHAASWARNALQIGAVLPVIDALAAAKIDVLLLKGAALLDLHPCVGCRPANDVDLLVRERHAPQAVRLLRELGWRPQTLHGIVSHLAAKHAVALRSETGVEIDLHWRLLPARAQLSRIWNDTDVVVLQGRALARPDRAHLVVHACAHGLGAHPTSPLWLLDLEALAGRGVDWHAVIHLARELEVSTIIADGLRTARDLVRVPVPPEILDELGTARTPWAVRAAHRHRHRRAGPYLAVLDNHRRCARLGDRQPTAFALLDELATAWELPSRRAVLLRLLRKGVQVARWGRSDPGEAW